MKTPLYLRSRMIALALMLPLTLLASVPVSASAASSSKTSVSASATIDSDNLTVDSGDKPRITGTATDVSKVRVTITASSSSKVLFKSSSTKVKSSDTWSVRVTKKLKDGQYTVSVYDASKSSSKMKLLATSTLSVGIPPVTLSVSSIPLLSGGVAKPGSTVPISYLQVVNQGSVPAAIKGFWVRQDGSASTDSVIGFSSVDDKGMNRTSNGGTEGVNLFKNGVAFVPSTSVLAPGERRLYTLKAQLSASSGRYAGAPLMLNVTGVDAAASFKASYPIQGTTWTLSAY